MEVEGRAILMKKNRKVLDRIQLQFLPDGGISVSMRPARFPQIMIWGIYLPMTLFVLILVGVVMATKTGSSTQDVLGGIGVMLIIALGFLGGFGSFFYRPSVRFFPQEDSFVFTHKLAHYWRRRKRSFLDSDFVLQFEYDTVWIHGSPSAWVKVPMMRFKIDGDSVCSSRQARRHRRKKWSFAPVCMFFEHVIAVHEQLLQNPKGTPEEMRKRIARLRRSLLSWTIAPQCSKCARPLTLIYSPERAMEVGNNSALIRDCDVCRIEAQTRRKLSRRERRNLKVAHEKVRDRDVVVNEYEINDKKVSREEFEAALKKRGKMPFPEK